MIDNLDTSKQEVTGDALLAALSALANPHRLRIVALLTAGRMHVSQVAREVGMSRPLVHVHLQRLEAAGLVKGSLELSQEGGKAMKYFEVAPFSFSLSPASIAEAARTLASGQAEGGPGKVEAEVERVQERVGREVEKAGDDMWLLRERLAELERLTESMLQNRDE
ncbi:MAG: winged helix-turn-helix transcriptional regulator [SAR202 cluster bacterium]|nr:winged helix-turn-helix transcriptional regulator [SAR202 cluster bacterium]